MLSRAKNQGKSYRNFWKYGPRIKHTTGRYVHRSEQRCCPWRWSLVVLEDKTGVLGPGVEVWVLVNIPGNGVVYSAVNRCVGAILSVIVCAVTFGMTSSTMFYYTTVMTNLFTLSQWDTSNANANFRGITSLADWFSVSVTHRLLLLNTISSPCNRRNQRNFNIIVVWSHLHLL